MPEKAQHTSEPWSHGSHDSTRAVISGADGVQIATFYRPAMHTRRAADPDWPGNADLLRTLQCVNGCAGLLDPGRNVPAAFRLLDEAGRALQQHCRDPHLCRTIHTITRLLARAKGDKTDASSTS